MHSAANFILKLSTFLTFPAHLQHTAVSNSLDWSIIKEIEVLYLYLVGWRPLIYLARSKSNSSFRKQTRFSLNHKCIFIAVVTSQLLLLLFILALTDYHAKQRKKQYREKKSFIILRAFGNFVKQWFGSTQKSLRLTFDLSLYLTLRGVHCFQSVMARDWTSDKQRDMQSMWFVFILE